MDKQPPPESSYAPAAAATTSRYFAESRKRKAPSRFLEEQVGMKATAIISLAATAGWCLCLAPTAHSLASSSPRATPDSKRTTASITPDPDLASTSPKKQRKKSPKRGSGTVPRTESFDALWSGSLPDLEQNIEPHTLILGTHPSIKSLDHQQYYGHPMK
jgi:hypothetical protein